jgi:hypothetical protein
VRIKGVRGAGHIFPAVFLRSRATLQSFAPLECRTRTETECLDRLAELLQGRERN